jgi:hypothetical protein
MNTHRARSVAAAETLHRFWSNLVSTSWHWRLPEARSFNSPIAVGIATDYELDDRGVGVRAPVGLRILSPSCPDRLWVPSYLLYLEYRGSFLDCKAAGLPLVARSRKCVMAQSGRQYADWQRAGWGFAVLVPVGSRIFSSPQLSNRLWGPPSLRPGR